MQVGGGNERWLIRAHNSLEVNEYLVKAKYLYVFIFREPYECSLISQSLLYHTLFIMCCVHAAHATECHCLYVNKE